MKILTWPNPKLKLKSGPVTEPISQSIIDEMVLLMFMNDGIGIAAIQVGIPKAFFLIRTNDPSNGGAKVIVNPVIKRLIGDPYLMLEGCLSVPNCFELIKRHPSVELSYWDQNLAIEKTEILTGQEAHVAQHEHDHLNGVSFPDKLPPGKRDLIRSKMKKHK